MTWNIIWQVSRSNISLHRVMSLGCRLRVRGCLLLPASQSLLVIVGSQVTLVSGNRSSWKYSNYTCKFKFTLNFFKYRYIHMCSEELLRYNVHSAYKWSLFIKVNAYTLWSKISFFLEPQFLSVSIFKFNSVCTFNKVHSFCLLQDNELFSKLWNNIIKNARVQKTKLKLFLINAKKYGMFIAKNRGHCLECL